MRTRLGLALLCSMWAAAAAAGLLVDDFDDGADPNALGGHSFALNDRAWGSAISTEYVSDPAVRFGPGGYSLKIKYSLPQAKGWCAWGMGLGGVDARRYTILRMRVRGSDPRAESFTVFLKNKRGTLQSTWTGSLITVREEGWLALEIPLGDGPDADYSEMETLMILFDRSDGEGFLLVDDIRFESGAGPDEIVVPVVTEAEEIASVAAPAEPEIEPDPPLILSVPKDERAVQFDEPPLTVRQARPERKDEASPHEAEIPKPAAVIPAAMPPALKPATARPPEIGPTKTYKPKSDTISPISPISPKIEPRPRPAGFVDILKKPAGPILTKMDIPAKPDKKKPDTLTLIVTRMDIPPKKTPKAGEPAKSKDEYLTYDGMENPADWTVEGGKGSSLDVKAVPGEKGKALSLRYSFGEESWTQITKAPKADFSRLQDIRLKMKPVKGTFTLEIKLLDEDYSNFGKKFEAVEADGQWSTLTVPLTEFTYWWGGDTKLDMKTLRGIYLAITKAADNQGEVHLDELEYRLSPPPEGEEMPGGKVVIDSFERSVPENAYTRLTGDNYSLLSLESVRDAQDGHYSMRFDYTLESTGGIPAYVSAASSFATPLDWTGVDAVKIWVRGDGSASHFRIAIVDRDEEMWIHADRHILKSNKWQLLSIPVSSFSVPSYVLPRNRKLDLDEIRRIELQVASDRTEKTTGAVWVDELYVTGKNLDPNRVGPAELRKGLVVALPAAAAAFNFGLTNFAEFSDVPEESQKVNHYGKFLFDAQMSKFSARIEVASDFQDYGVATYFDTKGALNAENPKTVLVNSQMNVSQLHPGLRLLSLGYLWIDFGRWTFTPQFGNKGLKAEGTIDQAGYEAFVIKKRYEGFAAGSRFTLPYGPWLLQGIFVYDNEYAQQTGSTAAGAAFRLKTLPIGRDFVSTLDITRKLKQNRITLSTLLGRNLNTQFGTKTGTFSPTVLNYYAVPLSKSGNLGIFEAKTNDYPWKRFSSQFQYRWIGTHFKPSFREGGISFDDAWADQKGFNVRVSQAFWKATAAAEIDHIARVSGTQFKRDRKRLTFGFYGIRNIDVAISAEDFKEVYRFSSDRTSFSSDKNEKKFTSELYLGFRMSDKLRLWAKGIEERIRHPANNNAQYKTDIFQTRVEYYVSNNSRIFAEHKFTQFGNPAWEPTGSPFDDNFTKLSAELNF